LFEDSDDDDSAFSNNDEDPWIEQVPSTENENDDDGSSIDSTLDDLKQPRRNQSDGAIYNSYQTFNHIEEMGRSTSLTAAASATVQFHTNEPSVPSLPHATPFRPARRATAFAAIKAVEISPSQGADSATTLEAIAQQAVAELKAESQDEGTDVGPSFREFALLSWNTNKLSLLADESKYKSDGPRHLDAYCLDEADFMDIFPQEASHDCINPQALSKFCFPNGLRIRIVPRVAMPGAMRNKWAGVGADSCHILVVCISREMQCVCDCEQCTHKSPFSLPMAMDKPHMALQLQCKGKCHSP
jgi:hypothetical protein